MQIIKPAIAGTLESSDVLIRILPATDLDIEINSTVGKQFGDDILNNVQTILEKFDVKNAHIMIEDKGALDCVLQARLKAALLRATDESIAFEVML